VIEQVALSMLSFLIGSMEVCGAAVPIMARTMGLVGNLIWEYNKANISYSILNVLVINNAAYS
jgi:hypothetical protein